MVITSKIYIIDYSQITLNEEPYNERNKQNIHTITKTNFRITIKHKWRKGIDETKYSFISRKDGKYDEWRKE